MNGVEKTKEQLLHELATAHQRIAELEGSATGRKKTAGPSGKNGDELRALINATRESLLMIDAQGSIILANEVLGQRLGKNVDELIGTYLFDHFSPHVAELRKKQMDKVVSTGKPVHFEDTRNDRFYSIFAYPVMGQDGRVSRIAVFANDITEQKQAEKKLLESEERYRAAIENSNDGVIILQGNKRLYYNKTYLNMFGYDHPEEYENTSPFSIVHPDDREMVIEYGRRRQNGETVPSKYECRMLKKDGSVVYVEISASAITYNGETTSLGYIRDITERKRIEEERLELERQLLHTQKLESLGVLAGGIAHDFNNLLMGIQGYISLMLYGMETTHPYYYKLRNVEDMVRSGSDLTGQLLGFARGGKYEVKPTDLNALIKKSAAMFGRTKREITIHEKFAEDLFPVEVDRGQIEQVFLNLYLNASQAMPEGGDLFLETENVFLDEKQAARVSLKRGKYVKVSIIDTGMGMDKATQKRIFEPFFTTKEMGRGSGLGLASAYGIAKHHEGIIHVSSRKGHGSTFTIYLPASEKTPVEDKEVLSQLQKGLETILLVDDQDMVLDTCREILQTIGYTVLTANSGQEALHIYTDRKEAIDLVILDMIMPGLSGSATYDKLKKINPRIKVLLSSGYSIDGQASEILEHGCSGFIQKPFDIGILSNKIREVLEE